MSLNVPSLRFLRRHRDEQPLGSVDDLDVGHDEPLVEDDRDERLELLVVHRDDLDVRDLHGARSSPRPTAPRQRDSPGAHALRYCSRLRVRHVDASMPAPRAPLRRARRRRVVEESEVGRPTPGQARSAPCRPEAPNAPDLAAQTGGLFERRRLEIVDQDRPGGSLQVTRYKAKNAITVFAGCQTSIDPAEDGRGRNRPRGRRSRRGPGSGGAADRSRRRGPGRGPCRRPGSRGRRPPGAGPGGESPADRGRASRGGRGR